jgi:hypothetical protein
MTTPNFPHYLAQELHSSLVSILMLDVDIKRIGKTLL